jgi:hypothetical protein
MCEICKREDFDQIDDLILDGVPIEEVARTKGISLEDLKIHFLTCSGEKIDVEVSATLADKLQLREAKVLENTYLEYYITLKRMGKKIGEIISEAEPATLDRAIPKQVVDLYIGSGVQIRETIKLLSDMETGRNGKDNAGLSAIANLVAAIKNSGD